MINKHLIAAVLILNSVFLFGQKSLKFDGSNDNVQTNYTGVMGSTNRTFESWIYVPSTAPNRNLVIMDYGRNAVGARNTFLVNTSRGLSFTSGGTNANMGSSANTVPLNRWVHVAFVLNNGTGYMYVNGIQVATSNLSTVNTTAASNNTNLRIGYRVPGGNTLYFAGQLDEVRIWNTALSVQEIRNGMCQEVSSSHSKYTNLQGYWKMDTLLGTTVRDYSGNSRNGTANNGPVWQKFGAPVGDKSANQYGSTSPFSLVHPDGDSITMGSITGNPTGVHLYRRDNAPNYSATPTSIAAFDSSRHWGVHFVGGSSAKGQLVYDYVENAHFKTYATCFNELLTRNENKTNNWKIATSTNSSGKFQVNNFSSGEVMVGYAGGKASITGPNGIDTAKGCIGDSILLTNSTSGLKYQWLLNGSALTGDTLNVLKAVQVGTYSLIINSPTCNDTSNSIYTSLNVVPQVSLGAISSACAGVFSVPLSGGNPSGGVYVSPFVSGNMFIVGTSGPGEFKVVYRYSDANGCSDTASQVLKIDTIPTVNLATKGDVCVDSTTHQLVGGTPAGGRYSVNGNTSTQFDPAALGAGNHKIIYSYVDANQCENKDSVIVKINPLPNVFLNLLSKKFCEYAELSSLDGNNPTGGLFSGTGVNGFNFNPKNAGIGVHSIKYTYKDRNTGCSNVALDTINVVARPAIPAITQNGNEIESSLAASYQWFDKNGVVTGETNKKYKPKRDGDYSVIVKNSDGCESEKSELFAYKITVQKDYSLNQQLSVFPIPADKSLTIEFESGFSEIQFVIYDISGTKVAQGNLKEGLSQIPVGHLVSNLYFIEIISENGIQEMRKIVIEH